MSRRKPTDAPDQEPAQAPGVGERIVATASDLFYREGVRAVGVQRVIEEAGIAKASLYAHYGSKDDLVAACLGDRAETCRAQILERLAAHGGDSHAKLLVIFDFLVDWVSSPGFRGCPFLNAGSEIADPTHPAKQVIAVQRQWWRELLVTLATDAGAASPDSVASTLIVLYDGGTISSLIDGTPFPARHARWAAEQVLEKMLPRRRSNRHSSHR